MNEPAGFRVISTDYIMELVDAKADSIAAFADMVGVSRQFMHGLLHGRKGCRQSIALTVAHNLGVPASTIFMDRRGRPAHIPTRERVPQ